MRARLSLLLVLVGIVAAIQASAQFRDISPQEMRTEQRVALVIGNSGYPTAPLRNPLNDARAIAAVLERSGFQVTRLDNAGQKAMRRAVIDFGARLRQGGVGLFYYAGHGLQVNGRNYMVPVDAEINSEAEVEVEALDVAHVLSRMETASNRMNIVILDACRANPFARRFRTTSRGLAFTTAPSGTLIAYATAPGDVAADGEGTNGVYTGALLQALGVPGLRIEDVFKRVRVEVQRQTQGKQVPWESSSLVGEFVFVTSPTASTGDPLASERQRLEAARKAVEEQQRIEAERVQMRAEAERLEAERRRIEADRVQSEEAVRREEEARQRVAATSAPSGPQAPPAGQMTWSIHLPIAGSGLDPGEAGGLVSPLIVLYALHDALVKPMPGNAMAPSLAESWSVSPDGRTWDFVLRRGARFHNGDPVTAADAKFSFERSQGTSAKLLKERMLEVRVVDPLRVRFRLKDPWSDFLTFYATPATGAGWIVPKSYVERVGDDGFKKAPIGAGPYRFVSYTPGGDLVLEAFQQYWRKTPHVKRLVFRSAPDESTRLAMLKRGEVDVAYSIDAGELQRTPGVTAKPTVAFLNGVGPRVAESGLGLIAGHPYSAPYEDVRLRDR